MDTKKVVTNETSNDVKREKVRVIPIQFLDDFPKHPFNVKMDEEMEASIESIKEFGILTPLVARKKGNERYEIIAGHRRKFAAKKLGFTELPLILREMTKDEAVIAMVDSNLHRERILPSERAYAYKIKMEARKRQGKRTDLTFTPVVSKLNTYEELAQESGDSREQIRRFIRLTFLIKVARINDLMWSELFAANKDVLFEQMNLFIGKFNELKAILESDDIDGMRAMMRHSTERRALFDKK